MYQIKAAIFDYDAPVQWGVIPTGLIGQVRRIDAFSLYLNVMGVPLLRSFYKL
ncbi:MAG: hypothetical protein WC736_11665 [Gallionella sp.]|jgi:hypothetical protein